MAWRWPREPSEPSQRRTDGSQPDRWLVTSGIVSEVMSVIGKRSLLAKQYEQNAKDAKSFFNGIDPDRSDWLAIFVDCQSWRSACARDAGPVGRRVRGIYFPLRYRGKALRASLIAC
jgi:hypothetical protein